MTKGNVLKVYIAAPYPWRENAVRLMQAVESAGLEVTSTWLRALDVENDAHARLDLADVARADVLVAVNPPDFEKAGTGGRHVELGYALGLHKRIVLVGNQSNIFHHLSDVIRVESCDLLVRALVDLPERTHMPARDAAAAIIAEFYRAESKHKPMNSHHEAYAVIQEEVDEMWDDIKADRKADALKEAIQVGAMAMRFIANLSPRLQADEARAAELALTK